MAAAVREGERGTDMSEGIEECIRRFSGNTGSDDNAHNFEPRYDESIPIIFSETLRLLTKMCGETSDWYEKINKLRERRYIHDVCTKCGAVVKRGE